jgi:hypothetical protein
MIIGMVAGIFPRSVIPDPEFTILIRLVFEPARRDYTSGILFFSLNEELSKAGIHRYVEGSL